MRDYKPARASLKRLRYRFVTIDDVLRAAGEIVRPVVRSMHGPQRNTVDDLG